MLSILLNNTDIGKIYSSGQCFGISQNPYNTNEYWCVSGQRFCRVVYKSSLVSELTCFDEDKKYWLNYFDMETNYSDIAKEYLEKDGSEVCKDIVGLSAGLRMLNQEFPDCLISFITSQRKSVPAIRTAVSGLCRIYGKCYNLEDYFGSEYAGFEIFTFPAQEDYDKVDIEVLDDLGFGYRSLYIVSAFTALQSGMSGEELRKIGYLEAKDRLKCLHGVGEKIANCVALYSLGYKEAYPRDVWIERFEEDYCGGKFVDELYDKAGIIQLWQYYFMLHKGK